MEKRFLKRKPHDTQDGTMVDTHAHIRHAEFDANRGQVLKKALAAGVPVMVTVCLYGERVS